MTHGGSGRKKKVGFRAGVEEGHREVSRFNGFNFAGEGGRGGFKLTRLYTLNFFLPTFFAYLRKSMIYHVAP